MQLIAHLEHLVGSEESLFRAQLLREDIARLRKLQELARKAPDAEAFKKSGMRIGWTQGDARTHELREPLGRLPRQLLQLLQPRNVLAQQLGAEQARFLGEKKRELLQQLHGPILG